VSANFLKILSLLQGRFWSRTGLETQEKAVFRGRGGPAWPRRSKKIAQYLPDGKARLRETVGDHPNAGRPWMGYIRA
jgi:hypothetical protein